jgi:hypothetical protein
MIFQWEINLSFFQLSSVAATVTNLTTVLRCEKADAWPESALSLELSTACNGRGGGIRTPDPLLPKQMRYQTALRPDFLFRL